MTNEPKRTEANSREIRAIEYIAGLEARIIGDEKYVEKRLKSVPDLWRQYRIVSTAITKVVDGLYDTLEPNVLHRMRRLCDHAEVVFRTRSPLNKSTDTAIVLEKDINVVINAAMESRCAICLKEGSDIKKCELRKALMNIAPPSDLEKSGSLCPYSYVAAHCDLGEYI